MLRKLPTKHSENPSITHYFILDYDLGEGGIHFKWADEEGPIKTNGKEVSKTFKEFKTKLPEEATDVTVELGETKLTWGYKTEEKEELQTSYKLLTTLDKEML